MKAVLILIMLAAVAASPLLGQTLLSQNQPVTASGYQAGNLPSYGNDGNTSTRWAAASSGYPQFWQVDLGAIFLINQADIDWYSSASRAYQYQIWISTDNVNFSLLVNNTNNVTFSNTTNTFSAAARYVQVVVTGTTAAGGYASFYECQIYGTPPPPPPAQTYTPPASERTDTLVDSGWRFIQQDVPGAQTNGFNDSSWTNVNLPHCWDIADGQSYPASAYYQGIGWYRLHYTVNPGYTNRELFLKFDGAFLVADVYVNGTFMGEHQGGFAAFTYDVTTNVVLGADNVIAVKVNNAVNTNVPPLAADFTFWGGIYRDVHLLVTDPLQVSPLDYGSPGVYLKPTNVSSNAAALQVTTVISNAYPVAASVTVRAVITDAATNVVALLTNFMNLPPGSVSNAVASIAIASPHLWNGLANPYLYQAFVEVYNGTNLTDLVGQPLGFRYYSINPSNGFSLNGQPYDLHGVAMHQDWLNCGWALTNAQRDTNFLILKQLGATVLRMCHYEHNDYEYQLADQNGVILWSEIPLIDGITQSAAFYTNAEQQLRELIRQRFNHPAVICWGTFNEITINSGPSPTNLVAQLVQLEAQEDPSRPSSGASLAGNGDPTSWMPQVIAFNEYFGWYETPLNGLASWSDNIHAANPNNAIGLTEYGAGASIYQHSENPVAWPTASGGLYHPEEWQNLVHETNWAIIKARPAIWIKTVWNLCDFASDGRDEGDTPGRNDKGLVTYDRQIRKDAFYFYQANWTTNPMVYITGHTFTNRLTNFVTAKVYANCDSVQLFVNGVSQGSQTSTNFIFTWPVLLSAGGNSVQAVGTKGASNVTDSLVWMVPFALTITNPSVPVVYLANTGDALQVSASVTNASGPVAVAWSQASGPAPALFSNSNALATTVSFPAAGIYGLNVTATIAGASASAGLSVVVGSVGGVTNGLLAWWKMDETGGATAYDSSGNGLNAAVNGAVFTAGYLSNALSFNGSIDDATFASPDAAQITVAAWVRAAGAGNSLYPRILETPGYRLFYRYDSQGSNGFDFATFTSTANGDWFSGPNTVSTGAWYHVAASYDRTSLTNQPALYVSGVRISSPAVISSPAGVTPSSAGTGYIGNRAALDRAWSGLIDDLRIYNRLLSDAEVRVLAAMPMTNLAPVVNAGANQVIAWPAAASLTGTVTDDGNPNPPGAVTPAWSQLSGPGTVTFANPAATATTASFPAPGNYGLQLSAYDGQVQTVASLTVTALVPPVISLQPVAGALQFSWPTGGPAWRLQVQTNSPNLGLGTNWFNLSGAAATNPFTVPFDPGNGTVFYRLVYP